MNGTKKLISIDSVQPGMQTAEAVVNRFGGVILWENSQLETTSIERLKNNGIKTVWVYEKIQRPGEPAIWPNGAFSQKPAFTPGKKDKLEFTREYEQNVSQVKNVFEDLASGKKLHSDQVEQIVSDTMERVEGNRELIGTIMVVRDIDEYTYFHSMNVSLLCMMMGKWMKMSPTEIKNCTMAGLLHDVGKTKVSAEILSKPGILTPAEFEEVKRHSELGYIMVSEMPGITNEVAVAVLTHHEKEDGSGYPLGLKGNQLNIYSKIITIADIFDAMTANKTYRAKDTPFRVFELMQHGSFGVLDPYVLSVFLENITHYYIGSKVLLDDGRKGEVIFMNRMDFSKPVIQVGEQYVDTALPRAPKVKEFL